MWTEVRLELDSGVPGLREAVERQAGVDGRRGRAGGPPRPQQVVTHSRVTKAWPQPVWRRVGDSRGLVQCVRCRHKCSDGRAGMGTHTGGTIITERYLPLLGIDARGSGREDLRPSEGKDPFICGTITPKNVRTAIKPMDHGLKGGAPCFILPHTLERGPHPCLEEGLGVRRQGPCSGGCGGVLHAEHLRPQVDVLLPESQQLTLHQQVLQPPPLPGPLGRLVVLQSLVPIGGIFLEGGGHLPLAAGYSVR